MFSAIKQTKLFLAIVARFVVLKLYRSLTEYVEHKVSIAPIWARFIQFITSPETSISSRKKGNGDEKKCVYVYDVHDFYFLRLLFIDFSIQFP
jgi:hypothetical protein